MNVAYLIYVKRYREKRAHFETVVTHPEHPLWICLEDNYGKILPFHGPRQAW